VTTALVYGVGVAGRATARALVSRGLEVIVADDSDTAAVTELVDTLGCRGVSGPDGSDLDVIVADSDLVVPAPGVPETHRIIECARRRDVEIVSEIELAYRFEQTRPGGPRAMLAVTGTDGKTTTTELATAMINASGRRALAVGNTERPLIDALDEDVDAFVVECSSFRLAFTSEFRADASVWLNLAPDHQNWHTSMDSYIAAKARMWAAVQPDDVAIGVVSDPIVASHLDKVPCRRVRVGQRGSDLQYRVDSIDGTDMLITPQGPVLAVEAMWRSLPHDRTNALCAAALVLEAGLADPGAVAAAVSSFTGPPHRIEFIATIDAVAWYDDSKATTPHAALAAITAFDSMVLIAGGRNKGLDLSVLATGSIHLRAVVAVGEAAPEVAQVFEGHCHVARAADMSDAVAIASRLAHPGDAVVLSPACASFDAYRNYGERGDDFARHVRALHAVAAPKLGDPR
jgi:UDP-N-acetylmuramoylalanine--D-glutamate ligase